MTSMPSQRPKLSLKTSDLAPTYVTSTAGRNDAIGPNTATPTTLNTFNNTFDLTYRPSPVSTIPSPGPSLSRRPTNLQQPSPYALNLPFGVYSILKNSPLPRDVRRSSLATASASPRTSGRRMFFPAPKRVSFKPVLEEEIVTTEYVTRHADLTSSSDEDTASSEESESSSQRSDAPGDESQRRIIRVDEFSSPQGRNKRKTRATSDAGVGTEDRGRQERSRSTSERRTKRKTRRWEWTIPSTPTKADAHDSPEIKDGSDLKSEGDQIGEGS